MCGIAGLLGRRDEALVQRMLGRIRHRGPDDVHVEAGRDYTLGAARLSIIDVDGGRQPLRNEDGAVVACQNGEIYDFVELRAELEAAGHVFHSRTDTEVLAHGWEQWGAGLCERLVGMFAVAVWDERKGEGLLARDRVGKKPLYYHVAPDGAVAFASEIKSLLEVPSVSGEVDPVSLDLFMSLKHVPCPRTSWRDVRMLPAGHRLRWRRGQPPLVEPYWRTSWKADPSLGSDPAALDDELLRRLTRAVDRRLRSDVPIAFFLSGGVDSSLVAAIAATRSSGPIHTYTLTYGAEDTTPGKELDRRCARMVAEQYGTRHVEETITQGDLRAELPTILRHFDDPFSGVLSTWYLSRRIARDVKVALAGDGADELFGSYKTHRLGALLAHDLTPDAATAKAFGLELESWAQAREEPMAAWRARVSVLSPDDKRALYTPGFQARLAAASGPSVQDYLRELVDTSDATDPLARILDVEWRSQLPDQVMCFADRLSMAHSLELRAPFLDQDVVELVSKLPPEQRIGRDGGIKVALRRAARRLLPADVIDRPKEGFLMPITPWLSRLGPWLREALSAERLARVDVLAAEPTSRLVERFLGGDHRLGPAVFSALALQTWHDLNFAEARGT